MSDASVRARELHRSMDGYPDLLQWDKDVLELLPALAAEVEDRDVLIGRLVAALRSVTTPGDNAATSLARRMDDARALLAELDSQ